MHLTLLAVMRKFFRSFAGETRKIKPAPKINTTNMSALHTVFTHALLNTFFLKAHVHCQVLVCIASFPGPTQLICCLQYRKVGRAWYLFSCEHDIIRKWRNFQKKTGSVLRIVQPTTRSTLGVYNSCPPLARCVQ